jgi:hypothetical protein
MSVNTSETFARQAVIAAAAQMIKDSSSRDLTYDAVAERAKVDVAKVDELFDSPSQLVAEAQMANYFSMIEPHHLVLSRVESAIANLDETSFWTSLEENIDLAWSSGQIGEKWGIVNLLHDIWGDPFSQRHFCDLLDIQFERWIEVIENAQRLGWIDRDLDAKALTAVVWSASIGQVIMSGSVVMDLSAQSVRDFFSRMVRAKSESAPNSDQ